MLTIRIVKEGFEDIQEILREINKDKPGHIKNKEEIWINTKICYLDYLKKV